MNVLGTALTLIQNLIPNQVITIFNTTSTLQNGVARPLASSALQTVAQIQPLTAQEVRQIDSNIQTAQEYYRIWLMGDDLQVLKQALDQNKESRVVWRDKEFYCYSKTDWALNGWIEGILALRGEYVDD